MITGNHIIIKKKESCITFCCNNYCDLVIGVGKFKIEYKDYPIILSPYFGVNPCYEKFLDIISIVDYRRFL